ncbi:MAG: DMT family transporter [Firmicutes bacterium]|nr:DMT family transporter [Bacillota bacterium]
MTGRRVNPYLALGLGVLGLSSAAIFTRLAAAPALVIAFYRLGFTAVMLAPFTMYCDWQELMSLGRRDLLACMVAGTFLAGHFALWILSLEFTTVASSVIFSNLQVIFVLFLSTFWLKERVTFQVLLGVVIAVTGGIIIGAGDFHLGGSYLKGDLLSLAGALLFALYILTGRQLRQRLNLLPYVLVLYTTTTAVLWLFGQIYGVSWYPQPVSTVAYCLLLAMIPTIGGHTVLNWVLRFIPAPVVALSVLGEAVGASIFAFLLFAEVPTA